MNKAAAVMLPNEGGKPNQARARGKQAAVTAGQNLAE